MDEKELELASDITEGLIDVGIAKARVKMKKPEDFDGTCECGTEIPAERIAMELYICVHCATKFEKRKKTFR